MTAQLANDLCSTLALKPMIEVNGRQTTEVNVARKEFMSSQLSFKKRHM